MLKRFVDFLLFGNIYVAFGAFCLVQSTAHQLCFTSSLLPYSLLCFFATLFVYNLQRIFYRPPSTLPTSSIRRRWIANHQTTIKSLTLIGFTGTLLCFFSVDVRIIFYLSPLLALSLAYFLPFITLRKSSIFKLITLTTVWTIATALVPILISTASFFHPITTQQLVIHVLLRFSFMMSICIPFDIRDLAIDRAENTSTLPQLIGQHKTIAIAAAFILFYTLVLFVQFITHAIALSVFLALLTTSILTLLLIVKCNTHRSEYYFVAAIDGTMILQGILIMISV